MAQTGVASVSPLRPSGGRATGLRASPGAESPRFRPEVGTVWSSDLTDTALERLRTPICATADEALAWLASAHDDRPEGRARPRRVTDADGNDDLVFSLGASEREGSVRQVFAALRAHGVRPHRGEPAHDDVFVERLGRSFGLDMRRASDQERGVKLPAPGAAGDDDSSVSTDPTVGVSKGRFTVEAEGEDTYLQRMYGWYDQAIADIAAIGGGYIRQMDHGDLIWRQMFPDTEIPEPSVLLEQLQADSFAAFTDFGLLHLACALSDVRMVPCLFTWGGGDSLNGTTADDKQRIRDPATGTRAPDGLRYGALSAGKPRWQSGYVIPSVMGWSTFYWSDVGYTGTTDEETYQRYVLDVLPDPDDLESYQAECARRKGLALVAFSMGVRAYLRRVNRAMVEVFGPGPVSFVNVYELGNEMDAFWGPGATDAELSAREFGTFAALLAGPIRSTIGNSRFRLGDLASYGAPEEWVERLAWLEAAIDSGVGGAVSAWNALEDGWRLLRAYEATPGAPTAVPLTLWSTLHPGPRLWMTTCRTAGVSWPPEDTEQVYDVADLLHRVGFHWFHCSTVSPSGPTYQSEEAAADDWRKLEVVLASLEALYPGLALRVDVGSIGFPAVVGYDDYFDDASLQLQGSMLVRLLLTFKALGAYSVAWFTHMSFVTATTAEAQEAIGRAVANSSESGDFPGGFAPPSWGLYSSMGLRVDVVETPVAFPPFAAESDAWPRPSYFAFRRL